MLKQGMFVPHDNAGTMELKRILIVLAILCCNVNPAWCTDKTELAAEIREAYDKYTREQIQNVSIKAIERHYHDGKVSVERSTLYLGGHGRSIVKGIDAKTGEPNKGGWLTTKKKILHVGKAKDVENQFILKDQIEKSDLNFFAVHRAESGFALPFSLYEVSTFGYLMLPDFELTSVTDSQWKGRKAIKVVGERALKGGVQETLYFDVEHKWYLLANTMFFHKSNKITATYEVEYDENMIPKKVEWYEGETLTDQSRNMTIEIVSHTQESHPPSTFSLAQFDLPEPLGEEMPTQDSSLVLYLIFGILALMILIVVVKRRTARRQSAGG